MWIEYFRRTKGHGIFKIKTSPKTILNIINNVVFFKTTTFWNFYKLFSSNFWSLFYFSTPFFHLIFLLSDTVFPTFPIFFCFSHSSIFSPIFFPSLYLILIFHFLYFINPSLSFYLLLLQKFSFRSFLPSFSLNIFRSLSPKISLSLLTFL